MNPPAERAPAGRAGPVRARPRRAPVGHPQVLRHPRHDDRRDQPRGGGARLRHAASRHRGRCRIPARGPDPLHLELRDRRASAGALDAPRGSLRRRVRSGEGAAHHGRRLGGRGPRPAGDLRPRRRSHPPRTVVRRLCPRDRVRRWHGRPRRHALRGRFRPGSGSGRGRDHAADEGALPRLPVQPDRGRPARPRSRTRWPRSPSATTSSSTATRSTTASPTAPTPTAPSRRCRGCGTGRSSWAASRRPTR